MQTSTPTYQEVQAAQGTRLSDKNPWETYGDEFGQSESKELKAAIAEYEKNHYQDAPVSSQTKEELARLHEANEGTSKEYQWIKPEEYKDHAARIGRVMSHEDFINILRKCNVACWYVQHPHPDKATLLFSKNGGPREVVGWVQLGQMPELSIMSFDKYGVPLAEKRRGWRTVLLQILLKGIISEEKADKIFGRPKQTEAFHRYNSTLQSFRNAGSRLE